MPEFKYDLLYQILPKINTPCMKSFKKFLIDFAVGGIYIAHKCNTMMCWTPLKSLLIYMT